MCPYGHWVSQDQVRYENGVSICPACYPVVAAPRSNRIARPWRVVLGTGVLVGLALIVIGFVIAFIPLPKQTFDGGQGWCGPGETSKSAVSVRLHPDEVNEGGDPGTLTPAQQQALAANNAAFKEFCTGLANTRLEQSLVLLLPGLLIAGAAVAVSKARPRWLQDA
jgi:hypothetical protein